MFRFNAAKCLLSCFTCTYLVQQFHLKRQFHPKEQFRSLPPELSRSTVRLTCESTAKVGICEVYVVGTIHRTEESRKKVKAVVNFLKPQVVFLELCSHRSKILEADNKINSEFRVASEVAKKYGGKVILGDRSTKITLGRYLSKWKEMSLLHCIKSVVSIPFQCVLSLCSKTLWQMVVHAIKNEEEKKTALQIEWFRRYFPILFETLVDERDQYMSVMLLKVASEHNSVVVVVGIGHLPGIQKYWKQNIEVEKLLSMSSKE